VINKKLNPQPFNLQLLKKAMQEYKYNMKNKFEERMRSLLQEEKDFKNFSEIIHKQPRNFIRCNTIKISPEELMIRLRKKWEVKQPFQNNPEIILINQNLLPGELGNSLEHFLGYYYVQEISSMMSAIALDPKQNDLILDLCASPGSKTTQISAIMQNTGTIIANDFKIQRIKILSSNLEKCGVTNTIITRMDAIALCSKLARENIKFDRILLDVPCSGEGILRSSPKTFITWNEKVINNLSRQQKKFIANAIKLLKKGGTLIYSTCTHAPEENESVINFALQNFPVEIKSINLPLKCRQGTTIWKSESFNTEVKKACRIYPQDNDSEGFFIAKLILQEEIK